MQLLEDSLLTRLSRINLESSRREQRLLLEPRHRAHSLAGHWYTEGALSAAPQRSQLALQASEDAHPLYKDWEILNRWLKSEHDRIDDQDRELVRSSSHGATPAAGASGDAGTAAVLRRLQAEVEDAIVFEENRAKRASIERRMHLAPSDATIQQVRDMLPAPRGRVNTIDSEDSHFSFESNSGMNHSASTIKPGPSTPSPKASPSLSPQLEQEFFGSGEWVQSPTMTSRSPNLQRSSVSTHRSSMSVTSDGRLSPSSGLGLGISTAGTTPEHALTQTLRTVFSSTSLNTLSLGDAAMKWSPLCHKVMVERTPGHRPGIKKSLPPEIKECDVGWRQQEDGAISIRALWCSKTDGKVRLWISQDFSALGPSIPLTTTLNPECCFDFPRDSFGKLDKQWTDIKYVFKNSDVSKPFHESKAYQDSKAFQTLLYTNNGKEPADLLFDRPVKTISSDKRKPECRGKNLRLWRRTERHHGIDGPIDVDVIVLLFYTSDLEKKGHWVEEPHYAFEWLSEKVHSKSSDHLTLEFSKDPTKWSSDKLFRRRKSSQTSVYSGAPTSPILVTRRNSMEIPGITRSRTGDSVGSMAASIRSSHSMFRRSKTSSRTGNLNEHGYAKLDIDFQNSKDRKAFLEIWKKYVKLLGSLE
jgi:hypothetical protein